MSTHDPRRGLPSASAMRRISKCSGSVAMVNALRASGKYFELENKYAPSGTRIHWYLAQTFGRAENLEAEKELSGEEMGVARKCRDQVNEMLHAWRDNDHEHLEATIEKRFWYRTGIRPRFSGQPDLVVIGQENRACIFNYKCGRLEADPGADNLQLRTEAVVLKHNFPNLEAIDAAIVEPLVTWEPERVTYGEANLKIAEAEILHIVDEAAWNHKRTAGPWCVHCPARVNCNESLDYVQTIPNPAVSKLFELPRGELGARLWEKIGVAQKLLVDLKETYKKIMAVEPGALPGYILPELGHKRRTVVDPVNFKTALSGYLPPERIDALADYPIGKIEEAYGQAAGITGKKLATEFERLTARAVKVTNDEPFIRPLTIKEKAAMKQAIEAK